MGKTIVEMKILVVSYRSFALALLAFVLWGCGQTDESSSPEASYSEIYEREIAAAQKMAATGGQRLEGLALLAKLYHANGDQSKAVEHYRQLVELDSNNPKWPHSLASLLAGYGQIKEAIPFQLRASELAPQEPAPALRLGEMYLKLNQIEAASGVYQDLLEIEPGNLYALLGLARCDLANGDLTLAQERLEKAVSTDQTFIGGWALLATVLDKQGQVELADIARKKSFGRFVEFQDPWMKELWDYCYDPYQLSVAASISSDASESKKLLERAISLDPNSSSYRRQIGNLYLNEGNASEAKKEFEIAIELDPTDAESWSALVNLLMKEQDFNKMNEMLDKALALCPNSAYLHFMNGRRYAMHGLFEKAKKEFVEAKRIQPHESRSYVQLAMVHLMQGNVRRAKAEAELARKKEPSNPDVYVLLTKTSIMMGNATEAKKWYTILEDIPNHSPEDLRLLLQEYQSTFKRPL